MTVCIAAICENSQIIGASDRMLTAGDVQFEPEWQKIYRITGSILLMTAGQAIYQSEILNHLYRDVRERDPQNTGSLWTVEEIASLYAGHYAEAKISRAERDYLTPLALDRHTFLSRQKEMDATLVNDLARDLLNYRPLDVSAIIAGIDQLGPHIYEVDEGDIRCHDTVGFVTIGIGSGHASSQMMFARHSRIRSLADTLFLVYRAKKHSEVAPGVGKATDMVFCSGPTNFINIGEHVLERLESLYGETQRETDAANTSAEAQVQTYLKELNNSQPPKPETSANPEASQKVIEGTKSVRPEEVGLVPEIVNVEEEAIKDAEIN